MLRCDCLRQVMKGYHVYRQARGSLKREELAYIPHLNGATPAWIHDFAVSKNYVILAECPMYFNLPSITTGMHGAACAHLPPNSFHDLSAVPQRQPFEASSLPCTGRPCPTPRPLPQAFPQSMCSWTGRATSPLACT